MWTRFERTRRDAQVNLPTSPAMTMNGSLLLAFLGATLLVQIVPGPGMLFILANGIAGGPRAGVAAAFGAATGVAVHTTAAALGLAAILAHAPSVFEVARAFGAAYLVWLAIDAFRRSRVDMGARLQRSGMRPYRVYVRGLVNNLANPKVILFFVAFLPQFIDETRGHIMLQFLILGCVFLVVGLILDIQIGLTSGKIGDVLRRCPLVERLSHWVSGTILLGLAARLAFSREPR
jgi:threonine/homoserine/homoserine lactone efflux protein